MKTHDQLIEDTKLACESAALSLGDSPVSRAKQIFNHVGFYQGYCSAMQWDYDMEFVIKMIDLS